MNPYLDRLPCFVRPCLEAARNGTADARVHERFLREVLRLAGVTDNADAIGAGRFVFERLGPERVTAAGHRSGPVRAGHDPGWLGADIVSGNAAAGPTTPAIGARIPPRPDRSGGRR